MKQRMTKAEGRAFLARWKQVNDAEREELRRTPPSLKLRQLGAMMALARELGWTKSLTEGEAEIRGRWSLLRKAYGV